VTDGQTELVHAVEALRKSVDQLRDELVRKDVSDQVLRNITDRFKNIEGDIDAILRRADVAESNRVKDKWLILTGLVFPAIVGIILLYVATQIGGSPA
jgi:hypothetical protein